MKKVLSYMVGIILALLIIAPLLNYDIPLIVNSFHWVYLVVVCGLLGFYLWQTSLPLLLKILATYLFPTCFWSMAPYLSFNAYIVVVIAFYLFLVCRSCDFEIVSKCLEAAFWFEFFLALAQLLGKDTLMNFDNTSPVFLGTVMQYMRFSSVLVVLTPFLILKNKFYLIPISFLCIVSSSSSFALALIGGIGCYFFLLMISGKESGLIKKHHWWIGGFLLLSTVLFTIYDRASYQIAISEGRIPIWGVIIKTWVCDTFTQISVVNWKSIVFGRGLDTFLPIFPVLKHDPNPFPQAHNSFLQLLWETGVCGFGLLMAYFILLMTKLFKRGKYIHLSGMVTIGINAFFTFPERMTQTMFLMVTYFAFCQKQVERV